MYAEMNATLLEPLNSDNGICDAARVSFRKLASTFAPEKNQKMMGFLKDHRHWSPFGHAREIFFIDITPKDWLHFLTYANTAGFTWHKSFNSKTFLSGSAWAWYENLSWLPIDIADSIRTWYHDSPRYTFASKILFREPRTNHISCATNVTPLDEREFADIASISFRIKAPLYVARQLVKHQVDLCWNEVSRRYVDDAPEFKETTRWRARPDASIKQGSGAGEVVFDEHLNAQVRLHEVYCSNLYGAMIAAGNAPEQARQVLPLSTMTDWIWTGSVAACKRICNQRLDPHAQEETREVAKMIDAQAVNRVPNIWNSLTNEPPHVEYG